MKVNFGTKKLKKFVWRQQKQSVKDEKTDKQTKLSLYVALCFAGATTIHPDDLIDVYGC